MATPEMEHAYYIGNYMSGILYGAGLVMYFQTVKYLVTNHDLKTSRRRFFSVYTTLLILLLTIDASTNAVWGEKMWIEGRNYPGGVPAWFAEEVTVWYQTLSSTSVVAMILLGDALLIHRLFVFWDRHWWVMVLPVLAYFASLALAIIELVVAGRPGGNFFGGHTLNFGLPYYTITIGMNILITGLISFRLLRISRTISSVLGKDSSYLYINIVAILVESAAPYSIVGIMFLITYGIRSPTSVGFGQVWAKLTCLCPQLIVLRVVSGKAWKRKTISRAGTELAFGHRSQSAQIELPSRGRVKSSVGPSDEHTQKPRNSSGSTVAGTPAEAWMDWGTDGSGGSSNVKREEV